MAESDRNYEEKLKSAQARIFEKQFERALQELAEILAEAPDTADALYMSAVSARYLGRHEDARTFLDRLKAVAPEYGRAYQEEGHLFRAIGDAVSALNAFRRACYFNPALEASWRAQADILQSTGRTGEAGHAREQADRLAGLPKEVVAVTNLIHEGRLLKAEKLCRAFLQKNPRHVEAMRLLADIGVRFSVLDDAEFLLESAAEFEPDNLQVRLDYIQVLRKRQKYDAALEQSRRLYERNPSDPVFQSHYAIESMHCGDFERAFDLFDKVLEKLPGDPATLTSRGHALKTYGRYEDAVESYRAAFRTAPDFGDAYYGLANLKTYRFTDEEVDLMQKQEANEQLNYGSRIQICFSLGKAFEDRSDYESSFRYYERGNDLKHVQCRYDADQMEEELRLQAEVCTEALFEKQGGKGFSAPDPIFILGLPRAGSTLLEQILASHSQVDGTLELPNILALSHRLRRGKRKNGQPPYPQILNDLSEEQLNQFGRKFIEDTRVHRQGAPFFIDKMPNNFRHIGLIHLILPNAKIIDARRAPLACCFSGFKQLFAEGQEFTYGLEQVGRYYRDYVELMRHWDRVLPGKILRVQYEDVVADLETQVRRILDFCGLEFEDACVEYYKTERAVRTASSEQVRQPINTKGLEPWRPFEPYLDPLKEALGDVLIDYRQ
ncbi:MAG: sulfotransferase [Parvularculaceae bacterium]